jgi:hypothetical protein
VKALVTAIPGAQQAIGQKWAHLNLRDQLWIIIQRLPLLAQQVGLPGLLCDTLHFGLQLLWRERT